MLIRYTIHLIKHTAGHHFVCVRPEKIRMAPYRPSTADSNVLRATVTSSWNVGPYYEVIAQADGIAIRAHLTESALPAGGLERGMHVFVAFLASDVHTL